MEQNLLEISITSSIGSLILAIIFFGIFKSEKKKYLLDWSLSWLFLFSAYFLFSLFSNTEESIYTEFLVELLELLHAIYLLKGIASFTGRKIPIKWIALLLLAVFWTPFSNLFNLPFQNLLGFIAFAAIHIITAVIFLRSTTSGTGKYIAGISLIFWSFIEPDYQFAADYIGQDLGNFLIEFLGILTGLGVLIYFYENNKRELEENEARFKELFEEDLTGNVITKPDGKVIDCNSKMHEMLGYSDKNEFLNRNFKEFYVSIQDRIDVISDIKKTGKVESVEIGFRKKDGSRITLLGNAMGKFDNNGEIVELRGYFFDITDRKKAEEEVSRNNKLFEALYKISLIEFESEENLIRKSIEEIKQVSQSEVGYLNYIIEKKSVVICPSSNDQKKIENLQTALKKSDIWRDCLASEQYKIDEQIIRVEGCTIYNHLCIPVFEKEQLIALFGLINKPEGYSTQDAKRAAFFASEIWKIIKHNRSYRELQKMKQAVEQSPVSVIISNKANRIEYVNPKFTDTTGVEYSDVIGKEFKGLISPFISDNQFQELIDTIIDKKVWSDVIQNRNKYGEIIWESVIVTPIYNSRAEIENYLTLREDITEKKNADLLLNEYKNQLEEKVESRTKELKQSEERFRKIAELSQDLIVKMSRDFELLYVNNYVFQLITSDKDIVGKKVGEIQFLKSNETEIVESLNQVISSKKPLNVDIKHTEDVWIDYQLIPELEGDEVKTIIAYGRNITKRKKLEEQILDSLKKEKEVSEMKSGFVSMISHEFKTPLTVLLSSAEILELQGRSGNEENFKKHISIIRKSVDNLTDMVNEVLMLNKADAGKYNVNPESINIKELAIEIIEENRSYLKENQTVNFVCSLNKLVYNLDRVLVRNIIANLYSNALKYSPAESKIDLIIREEINNLVIEVRNEGVTLNSPDLKKIFEPFVRGKKNLEVQGTGLGLSIVKKSAELMEGSIDVKSNSSNGTAFIVKIPHNRS